jgi:hypothetical protein
MRAAISPKKTCTLKTGETICQNKEQAELPYLKQQKMPSVGHCNVITT